MDPFTPALEQVEAVRRREVSAGELAEMYLERIERLNPELNAFWLVIPELAGQSGEGLLGGVPVSIKDLNSIKGYPTTMGSRAFTDQVFDWDGFAVGRLRAEGAALLGKTTCPEFGTRPHTEHGLHGAARNPWNREHTTGGSSGGAAGAVAAGLCALSHGSDGGGSIRIPASCCGVVGLKPTRGLISPGPVFGEGWEGLSTEGPIARTVADAALGLDAMKGHLAGDPYWAEPEASYLALARPPAARLRVAFTTDAGEVPVDPEVKAAVESAARCLEGLGHQVTEGGPDTSGFRMSFPLIVTGGVASLPVPESREGDLDPVNQSIRETAQYVQAGHYVTAVAMLRMTSREVVAFWNRHDVLLTPTLTRPAPRLNTLGMDPGAAGEEFLDWLSFTYPYNCTGQPGLSLPLAMSSTGLPIGVQLVGAPRAEGTLLALGAQLEEAMPWRDRRPPGLD
ncbi:MAG TPA: amidase [Candidatus Dormibacteraeota bacterium]